MMKNKKFGLVIAIALLLAIGIGGIKLTEPSYALRMDVNPSIEIVSNRLNKVVEVNPLNDDAREMLKNYKIGSKNLKNTIEDLADLMVLKGYISGGKDNLVMITVDDDNASNDIVNKLNKAITAYLENKQIEATIVNQSIPKENASKKTSKEIVAEKISALNDDLDFEKMSEMTLKELIAYAESKNIAPQSLFNKVVRTAKHNGDEDKDNHVDIHKDDNDDEDNKEKMKENNKNGNKDNNNNKNGNKIFNSNGNNKAKTLIGEARAREIALDLVNGKIVEFELDDYDDDDDDDAKYEIEIIANGYEYEIEIDAYTGKVLEFEKDN